MIPKKEAIYEKALEMWRNDQYKQGCGQLADLTPEYAELVENGYISSAKSELMTSTERKNEQWLNVDFPESFKVDILEAMTSGIFISGTTGTGKSDLGMYIANQLMLNNIIVIVFDSSQDWKTRSSISQYQTLKNAYISAIPEQNMIYDISLLSVLDRQRLIENFSEQLYRHQASEQNRRQFFIIFEESSNYFKEGFMRSKRLANASMLLSEGRNYGVRFGLITQFSALIDKTAMRYMRQRYFGYTSEPRDVEYITMFFPKNKRQEIAETLRNLKAGQFIYTRTNGVSKIEIEPYSNNVAKTQIFSKIRELPPIKPIPQKDSGIIDIVTFISFATVILYALSQFPKG